jgi:predicted nucleic acid-binding protein
MQNIVLIDTGVLVALFDKSDNYHQAALKFVKNFKGQFISTTAVLTETCYLLDFSVETQLNFLTWVRNGAIKLEPILIEDLERIISLTRKYADLPMDFTDATLVAIGERLNIQKIASIDSDFTIYRFKQKQIFINVFKSG